jgi:hypothetical protein
MSQVGRMCVRAQQALLRQCNAGCTLWVAPHHPRSYPVRVGAAGLHPPASCTCRMPSRTVHGAHPRPTAHDHMSTVLYGAYKKGTSMV